MIYSASDITVFWLLVHLNTNDLTDILQVEVIGVLLLSCRAFEELFRNLGKKRHILGAFEKLRKSTTDFVMSVHPHRTSRLPLEDFFKIKFDDWVFFENLARKLKFH